MTSAAEPENPPTPDGVWEALYRAHAPAVLSAATVAAGGCVHEGWDATQQAFTMAWLHLTDPRKPSVHRWSAWLRKVAVRHVVHEQRRAARALPLHDVDVQSCAPLLDNQVMVRAEFQETVSAIALLPVRQRQALVLREIAGYSTAETASVMEVKEETVRSLVRQARRSLLDRDTPEGSHD